MSHETSSPRGKDLRIGRVSLSGQIYHVTMTTQSREAVFVDFAVASIAAKCLYADSITERVQTLAYVVMPDHVHWLLQLGEQTSLPLAVRIYKAIVSSSMERQIWQRGFHDHALRAEEDVAAVARYIVANPLRAGLCGRVGDYPFWNAVWL